MSYDAAMKNLLFRAATAATIALALNVSAQVQSADTTTTIKDDAKTVGHAVAHSAKAVGHTVADDSKKVGHAVAHGAKAVGAKAKEGADKVKGAVTGKSDEPAPKS
jgi:hypothetical protein